MRPRSKSAMGAEDRKPNWFVRHWRGELPLGWAFWTNTIGVNWLLRVLILIVVAFEDRLPLAAAPFLIAGIWSTMIGLLVWQTTGVMRSAFNYETESGKALLP